MVEVIMLQAILVAPDAEELAIISVILQRIGFNVLRANNLDKAIDKWGSTPLDMILICYDGLGIPEQVHRLRGITEVPLIIITDAVTEVVHVALLDAGVDLVIYRPFSARVLRAQCKALLRRATGMPLATLPTLTIETISLDPTTRTVKVLDAPLKRLTHLEFRLLYTLMVHKGQVMSTQQLVERVWGYEGDKDRDLVRGLVRRLRIKIEPDPKNPQHLVTQQGIGYVFLPGDEDHM
jgi:DNA-binding response OmpR family regulator